MYSSWQSASRKPKLMTCGVSGRRVILSLNFNSNFFQSTITETMNDIFTKRIAKGKLWKVQRQKVSHSDKEYCTVSYTELLFKMYLRRVLAITGRIHNAVMFCRLNLVNIT